MSLGSLGAYALGACSNVPTRTLIPNTTTPVCDELSFDCAKGNTRIRKAYINQIVASNPPPVKVPVVYRDSVLYAVDPRLPSSYLPIKTTFNVPAMSKGIVQDLKVEVYVSVFTEFHYEDEFLSALVDHEYVHVKDISGQIQVASPPLENALAEIEKRVFDVNGDLFIWFFELDAFYNQIQSFPKRSNLGSDFKNKALQSYRIDRGVVERKPKTPATIWILERYPQL